jgi:hypothetical protein
MRLKLIRAKEHLDDLKRELLAFDERKPYEGVAEISEDETEWWLRAVVREQPNPYWSTVIGDAVHNMRSALDYLACELVIKNGGTVTDWTQFPIYDRKHKFVKGSPRRVAGMSSKAATLIETLQPYYRPVPSEHPLAVLAYLSNGDKHRALQIAHWTTDNLRQQVEAFGGTPVRSELVEAHRGPIEDGAMIARFKFIPPPSESNKVQVNAQLTTYVLIENRWRARRLEGILNFIQSDVVKRLEPFFR